MKVRLKRREGFLKSVGAFLLCGCLLAGCAAGQEKAPQDPPVAVGRYVETEITPALDGVELDMTHCLAPHPDGTIDYFAESPMEDSPDFRSTLYHLRSGDNGQTWEQVPTPWLNEMNQRCGYEDNDAVPWFIGLDNRTLYCVFADGDQHMRLFTSEDNSVSEVAMEAWQSKETVIVDNFSVTEGGQLGVRYFDERKALYTNEGKPILEDNIPSGAAAAFADDTIYSFDENVLSAMTPNNAPKTIPLPQNVYEPRIHFAGGTLYLICKSGIYTFNEKTSVFEILMKGPRYQYGNPNCSINDFRYEPETDQFFVALSAEDGRQRIFRYAFDPSQPLLPQEQLSIFSIWHNEALERSILDFQTSFPNVEVAYTDTWSGGNRGEEEAAAALKAELAQGKGPDVILLDRMDVDHLVDQGFFLPLTPPEGCFDNVLAAFRKEAGYMALPARFDADLSCRAAIGDSSWEGVLSGKTRYDFDDPTQTPAEGRYFPMMIVAVNANSENQEMAQAFAANLFSEKSQEDESAIGFPVLKSAFIKSAENLAFYNAMEEGLEPAQNIQVVLEPGLPEQCAALTRMEVIPSQLEPDNMASPEGR